MPVELGSFDVIISMDWLSKYHAMIVYDEKIVRILYGNEILIVRGDGSNGGSNSRLNIISCTKTQKYIQKGPYELLLTIHRRFSKIAKPMTKLTQNSMKFDWREKEEAAFQTLKQKLCSAPILALPEGSVNFVLYCDASYKGMGTDLMQKEKVIAYASRQLKIHEKNYTTHDLELIIDQKELNMRQVQWLELLSDYDCEIRYHPGKANMVANALSHDDYRSESSHAKLKLRQERKRITKQKTYAV
ncbi:putative reverse transcriptase domain-containing protein [Tanacetum coccineum]